MPSEKQDRKIEEVVAELELEDDPDALEDLTDVQKQQWEFSKDYDRVLYSTAFRRLGGVAQVVTAGEVALFHNRLTHSLKTAQVGTRLANFLVRKHDADKLADANRFGGIDARVVRAACMAHDLGHPPFGHIAETELQRILSDQPDNITTARTAQAERADSARAILIPSGYRLRDSFEGNAQSFRIVTKLAFRQKDSRLGGSTAALNLTKGSLAALMKYPWPHGLNARPDNARIDSKWNYYDADRDIAEWALEFDNQKIAGRPYELGGREEWAFGTVEAQIMDWADDISYAVHDVEDFFRAGLIPLHHLNETEEWKQFFQYASRELIRKGKLAAGEEDFAQSCIQPVREKFPANSYEGYGTDRELLHDFASTTINTAIRSTRLVSGGVVTPSREQRVRIELLKQLTWYYVIDRPSLQSAQFGQRQMIRSLYRMLIEWVEEGWRGPGSGAPLSREKASIGHRRELPARLLAYLDVTFNEDRSNFKYSESARISRAVVDYMVSLTESQTIELHTRLAGGTMRSMLENWVQL